MHRLNIDPDYKPIKQKRCVFTLERYEAILVEVEKLNQARFIEQVVYPIWLTNVVLVQKTKGQ